MEKFFATNFAQQKEFRTLVSGLTKTNLQELFLDKKFSENMGKKDRYYDIVNGDMKSNGYIFGCQCAKDVMTYMTRNLTSEQLKKALLQRVKFKIVI